MSGKGKTTIDHETIKNWVEERGGRPAHVKRSGTKKDPGVLRIDFPGFSGEDTLEPISWESFFAAFDKHGLVFVYQDAKNSRFSKLVSRDNAELDEEDEDEDEEDDDDAREAGEAMDALDLLSMQHREVEGLFEQLESTDDEDERLSCFAELANNLAAHAKIEETMFYPAMFNEDSEEILRESVEEHLAVKRIIADLLDMQPQDPQFMAKVKVLRDLVDHHVEEEEDELFPEIRGRELENLEDLGRKMQAQFEKLLEGEPKDQVPRETHSAALPA